MRFQGRDAARGRRMRKDLGRTAGAGVALALVLFLMPALLVRQGWQRGMPGHRAVFQLHDGVQVAMTEMHAHAGIQAAGLNRGNGQNGLAHVAILSVQG